MHACVTWPQWLNVHPGGLTLQSQSRHRSLTWRPQVIQLHVVKDKVKWQHVAIWPRPEQSDWLKDPDISQDRGYNNGALNRLTCYQARPSYHWRGPNTGDETSLVVPDTLLPSWCGVILPCTPDFGANPEGRQETPFPMPSIPWHNSWWPVDIRYKLPAGIIFTYFAQNFLLPMWEGLEFPICRNCRYLSKCIQNHGF